MFFDKEELQERIQDLRKALNALERKKCKSKNWTEFQEDTLSQTATELTEAENELINMTFPN